MSGFVRRHPIIAFCLWFFPVGWAISFFPTIAKSAWGADLPFQPFAIGMQVWGLVGLLLITRLVDGPEGLRELWRRCVKVGVPWRWYAIALLSLPVPAVVLALAFFGPPGVSGRTLVSAIVLGFLLQTLITFVTVNFIEEVTWMGFVQAADLSAHGLPPGRDLPVRPLGAFFAGAGRPRPEQAGVGRRRLPRLLARGRRRRSGSAYHPGGTVTSTPSGLGA
jgi:hypothetical protein